MRRRRLVAQPFPSYLIIVLLALLAVTWYLSQVWRQSFLEQTAGDLKIRAALVIPQFQELLSPLKAEAVDQRERLITLNQAGARLHPLHRLPASAPTPQFPHPGDGVGYFWPETLIMIKTTIL